MKVVLMAGGKGTRISSISKDIPKPMLPIEGKSVLEHQIDCLREQGLTDIIITVGHLGQVIIDYFGDGSDFGVNIDYYFEDHPLGNVGALYKIKDKLTDDFLLLIADAMFDIDFQKFIRFHKQNNGLATILVHPNSHPYDSSLIVTDNENHVVQWLNKEDERPEFYQNLVNAGIHILSPKLLEDNPENEKVDLDRQLLRPLVGTGNLVAYRSSEYVKDMGTPERYELICKEYQLGRVKEKNLKNKQKAIFLDRDGTLNKYVGFLRDIDQFELVESAAMAVRLINESGYLAIVITNQPVIARGEVSIGELEVIHKKMETLLGKEGAYLDGIYYCPHHPDKGFEGERREYKIICDCRKPKPGLFFKAATDFNIDLEKSWMIGDTEIDMQAGQNAGCRTALVGTKNLLQIIERILNE